MRPRTAHLRSERGFTIVEVMAAMVVLLVGLAGSLKVYDGVAQTAATAKLREQGVALQRELVESARSLKYADLGPGTLVPKLQAQAGLGDASSGTAGWQVRRRGVTYTVAVGACTVDDPRDSTGPHTPTTFCATGAGTTPQATCATLLGSSGDIQGSGGGGTAAGDCGLDTNLDGQVDGLWGLPSGTGTDANADDYKRIVVLVRWRNGGGSRYVLQDSTVPSPGAADAVQVTSLVVTPASVTAPATTSVSATATTDRTAQTVSWTVDGELGAPSAMTGSGQAWGFTWALGAVTPSSAGSLPAAGEVVDGAYVVSARAYDEYGQASAERSETVVVNRRKPFSVPGQVLRNEGTSVLVAWTAARERDIATYRVYRENGGDTVLICSVATVQPCRDAAPLPGPSLYYVVGVDSTQEGDLPTAKLAATAGGTAPDAPTGLGATTTGGGVRVTWTAPATGAASYRVYRDGVAIGDLLGSVTGTQLNDTAPGTGRRDYYVTALSAAGVESAPAGPVSP